MFSPRPYQPPPAPDSGPSGERTPLERALLSARRNWALLLICITVVPAAALIYSLLQTPEYTSTASVLFTDVREGGDPEREAATTLQSASLEQIAAQTAEALPQANYTTKEIEKKIETSAAGLSDVIDISATDPEPELAARIANVYARQFVIFRRNSSREKILQSQELVEAQLEALSPQERESAEGEALSIRARQLSVRAAAETGNTQIVQVATEPDSPSSPKTALNFVLGLLLGIVLGVGLSLLRDQLDRRLKEPEEIEEAFGLPILATIPESQSLKKEGIGAELAGEEREAFQMLRAGLQYLTLEPPINSNVEGRLVSIMVTSPSSQDGKTTVSWNLAVAEARGEKKVLYLEADLRRPSLVSQLRLPDTEDTGLSLVLAGALSPQESIREQVRGVDLIAAGPVPPNPAELIDSPHMAQLLDWAKGTYDRIVIDTPPTTVVADALPLTTQVDGVIVVARLRHSRRDMAESLREQLAHTETTIGVVVNGVAPRPDDSYYRTPGSSSSFSRAYERLTSEQGVERPPARDQQGS